MKRSIISTYLLFVLCCQLGLNAPTQDSTQNSIRVEDADANGFGYVFNADSIQNATSTTVPVASLTGDDSHLSDEPAAPCLFGDVIYKHGDQIKTDRPCDYCLCIDGDVFCYWQSEATVTPITTGSEVTNLSKLVENTAVTSTAVMLTTVADATDEDSVIENKLVDNNGTVRNTSDLAEKIKSYQWPKVANNSYSNNNNSNNDTKSTIAWVYDEDQFALMNDEESTERIKTKFNHIEEYPEEPVKQQKQIKISPTTTDKNMEIQRQDANKTAVCISEGEEYNVGEILPKRDDSCLECVCSSQLNVICSPKNCLDIEPDSYKHEIESDGGASMDMFDVDVF